MARNKTQIGEKYNAPFPTALRKLMDERGETQENIARAAEKTRQTVSQYVNGISEPGYETLVKIADYFNVSTDYLLGRTSDPSRAPCAADELKLSASAIEIMSNFYQNVSVGKAGIEGLNLMIEKGYFLELAWRVKSFCEHVTEDINLSNKYKNALQDASSDPKFQRVADDLDIADDIEQIILSQHPEYQGRFRVFTGYRFVAAEKRELVDDFEKMLCKISGYNDFLSGLVNDGTWL